MTDDPKGPETTLSRRDFEKVFDRATGALHRFVLRAFRGLSLEVEDAHFHFDSAVLMPDFADCDEVPVDEADRNRITGLAVIRAAYLHAKKNTQQKCLVTGHTDRSGDAGYNLKLSQQRADNVVAVLVGDKPSWVAISDKKHKTEDYQQILKWVATIWGWDCDPGKVDNVHGPGTTKAIKGFQTRFNVEFEASIKTDGKMGTETWGAFFDVYMRVLMFILEVDEDGLILHQMTFKFVDEGKPGVGCGENHPITENRTENFRSKIDRRVEILFFDPAEIPVLDCHPAAGKCVPAECEIFHLKVFTLDPIPCGPIPPPVPTWAIRILHPPEPQVVESGAPEARMPPPGELKPLAGVTVFFTGAGGDAIEGTTDANGVLRIEVKDDPAEIKLAVEDRIITVPAGALKTIAPGEPVRHRLMNLGYGKSKLADWSTVIQSDAIKRFKKEHKISPVNDAEDDAFLAKLKEVHGS